MEQTYGAHSTGLAFTVNAQTDAPFFDFASIMNNAKGFDIWSLLQFGHFTKSINYINFNIAYNPNKSTSKTALFTASYGIYFFNNFIISKYIYIYI